MRSMSTWFRLIASSRVFLATLLCTVACCMFFGLGVGGLVLRYELDPYFLTGPLYGSLVAMAFASGVARVLIVHPMFDPAYLEWLSKTPWTPAHPLPKGPLKLGWADVAVVGLLTALSAPLAFTLPSNVGIALVGAPIAFLVGVSLTWGLANWLAGERTYAYCALSIPVAMGFLHVPVEWLAVAPIGMALVSWRGVQQSLHSFPWVDTCEQAEKTPQQVRDAGAIGWPYRQWMDSHTELITDRKSAAIEAILTAGCVWLLVSNTTAEDELDKFNGMWMMSIFAAVIAIFMRIGHYSQQFCDHLCLGQRIANRKWILPAHDRILLVPFLILCVVLLLPPALYHLVGLSPDASIVLTVAIACFLLRGVGPRVRELALTGIHSKFGQSGLGKDFMSLDGQTSALAKYSAK